VFRNHPLGYWLAYVRHLAGLDSAVVVVQTRCDRPEDEARRLPVEDAEIEGLPFFKVVQFSSLKNRGRAALDEALREAVDWLWQRQGRALIGAGRLRVRRRLEELREADAQVPAHERQYRTLSQEHFRQLCAEAGGVSSPAHLLDYLHQSGVVFYRAGLFGERIVLDQGWALEAIYTLFHREKCYRELKRLGGRFTRSLLDMLVWQAHSADEQALFIDMMQSCGLCFTHKPGNKDVEAEYIAPDLLPARAEVAAELEHWGIGAADASAVYRYALHQPGLLRSLMAEIGQQAGVNGLYWRDGVCVYERETRSHAVIEQESLGDWRGVIRISTHGGRAAELLGRLRKRLEAQNRQWGLECVEVPGEGRDNIAPSDVIPAASSLEFIQPPTPGLEYCVSYAWGDASPEGVARGEVVERLCQSAAAKGIHILRDRDDLALGERLSKFMSRIGQGDRVFVIISDKYLKSPNCMYELFEIWRVSRQESEEFLRRVRIYSTECAQFSTPRERLGYAIYWKQEHEALRGLIKEHPEIVCEEDFKAFKRMDEFARHVGKILFTVADVIHARRFEDLEAYGFEA
jgi:internalin A